MKEETRTGPIREGPAPPPPAISSPRSQPELRDSPSRSPRRGRRERSPLRDYGNYRDRRCARSPKKAKTRNWTFFVFKFRAPTNSNKLKLTIFAVLCIALRALQIERDTKEDPQGDGREMEEEVRRTGVIATTSETDEMEEVEEEAEETEAHLLKG